MKFGTMFANLGPFAEPDSLARLARKAEEVGIESMWAQEHVVVPVGFESLNPYSEPGKMQGPYDAILPDPLLSLAFAAAVTSKIRLATGVMILPQRHPAYVAKEMATLDVLSKGRAILGVGSGWLAEEFAALGIPFRERGKRTDESIRAIRSLWAGTEPFEGEFFRWPSVESNPKPVQKPGVPIVVGGHSAAAARRAARSGDGFFPAKSDFEILGTLFGTVREECDRIGRPFGEIELTTPLGTPDAIGRLEDLGVSRVTVQPVGRNADEVEKTLEQIGNLIAKN